MIQNDFIFFLCDLHVMLIQLHFLQGMNKKLKPINLIQICGLMLIKRQTLYLESWKKRLLFTAVLHKLAQKWFSAKYDKTKNAFNKQTKKSIILLQMYWVLGGVKSGKADVQCNRTEKVPWEIHRLTWNSWEKTKTKRFVLESKG